MALLDEVDKDWQYAQTGTLALTPLMRTTGATDAKTVTYTVRGRSTTLGSSLSNVAADAVEAAVVAVLGVHRIAVDREPAT